MASKSAVIQKKIDGIVYDLMFKTTASNVMLEDGVTVDAKIGEIASYISSIVTEDVINNKIDTAGTNLYNKIMGISGSDVTINEAYDTIKEIADWLGHEGNETAASIVADIKSLQSDVQNLIDTATKVEKSDNNGYIKVDGQEVEVYKHPDTHSATMIDETEDRKFVSATEKASWNAKSTVTTISSEEEIPETPGTNDYFFLLTESVEVTTTCVGGTASKSSTTTSSGSSVYLEFTPDTGKTIENGTIKINGVEYDDFTVDNVGKVAVIITGITENIEVSVEFVDETTV